MVPVPPPFLGELSEQPFNAWRLCKTFLCKTAKKGVKGHCKVGSYIWGPGLKKDNTPWITVKNWWCTVGRGSIFKSYPCFWQVISFLKVKHCQVIPSVKKKIHTIFLNCWIEMVRSCFFFFTALSPCKNDMQMEGLRNVMRKMTGNQIKPTIQF